MAFAGYSGTQWICNFRSCPLQNAHPAFCAVTSHAGWSWSPARGQTAASCSPQSCQHLARTWHCVGHGKNMGASIAFWTFRIRQTRPGNTCFILFFPCVLSCGRGGLGSQLQRPVGQRVLFSSLPLFGELARVYWCSDWFFTGCAAGVRVQPGGSSALARFVNMILEPMLLCFKEGAGWAFSESPSQWVMVDWHSL